MSSLKKNLGYQTAYEILNTCLPLITTPYVARVLGASQLGVFSFTQSIVNYFVLLAMLGVKNYGTRSIAAIIQDRQKVNQVFSEIYSLQLISSTLSLLLYSLYCFFFSRENTLISYIQALAIVSCILDINWLFSGLEMFKIAVARSTAVRVGTVVLILLLVKKPEDLWLYTLLMLGGSIVGMLILWSFVPRMIGSVRLTVTGISKHLKPNFMLFLPLLAMSIYHLMDKTMLGAMSTYEQSGFYFYSDKLINIPIGVIIGIGTVMLPRTTSLVSAGQKEYADKVFLISLEGVIAVAFAMTFGIIAIAKEFVPFFFGKGYDACILLSSVLAPVLIIKAISLTVRNEYLIPNKKDKIYIVSVVAGTVSNLIANSLLISRYGALGAVIGTLIAEFVSCTWQILCIHKDVQVARFVCRGFPYGFFGLIMVAAVRLFAETVSLATVWKLVCEIGIGVMIFSVCCLLYWLITKSVFLSTLLPILQNRKKD